MAIATSKLIGILNRTIRLLENTEDYQWGHMGSCNCGHLVQAITGESRHHIHNIGMTTDGDWSEKARNYCSDSGLLVDDIISEMLAVGFEIGDVSDIEYLSNPKVLDRLENTKFKRRRNSIEDVIMYFEAWVALLTETQNEVKSWTPRSHHSEEVVIYDSIPEEVLD